MKFDRGDSEILLRAIEGGAFDDALAQHRRLTKAFGETKVLAVFAAEVATRILGRDVSPDDFRGDGRIVRGPSLLAAMLRRSK